MQVKSPKTNASFNKILAFAIAIVLVLSFYSCNSNSSLKSAQLKTTVTPPTDTINFIGHWLTEGKREELVRDVAREYEFTNQNILVNLKFPDEIYFDRSDPMSNQKFVASIVNDPNPKWDIIMINNAYQTIADILKDQDWAKNSLVDFSEIPEFRKNTLPTLLSDSIKKTWGGIIPGPFIEGANWALWCNTAVAEKVGITIKQVDMTFDDFAGYIKAVNEYNKNNKDTIIALYEASDWKTALTIGSQLYASELGDSPEFFSENATEKKLKAWYKTLKAFEQLSIYQPLPTIEKTKPWDIGKDFVAKKHLFFSNGSWMYNLWTRDNMEKIANIIPCEYPTFKPTDVYIGAYQIIWAVLKNAKHKKNAIDFLLNWNTPSVAERWSNDTKCPTGIKESFASGSFGSDKFSLFTKHIDTKYGSHKYEFNGNSRYILGFKNKNNPNYFNEVARGEMSADEAMRKIRSQLKGGIN